MNMDFEKVLKDRVTNLRYIDKKISKEDLDTIIESALIAPSAKNRQPWRFYILNEEEKNKIADMMDEWEGSTKENELGIVTTIHRSANVIRKASDFILIYKYGEKVIYKETVDILSIGAAIENMLLAATNLGIDSTWIADVRFIPFEINNYLKIEDMDLMSGIALGYKAKEPKRKARYKKDYLILNNNNTI